MEEITLIEDFTDAIEFAEHPVKAYDPFYTRDNHLFDSYWYDFIRFLQCTVDDAYALRELGNISDLDCRRIVALCLELPRSAATKVKSYEEHSGNSLLNHSLIKRLTRL